MATDTAALKAYLFTHVYRHPRVMPVITDAEALVGRLFTGYFEAPERLPAQRAEQASGLSDAARARFVCDFVAGMTDRYAIGEHRRLFGTAPDLVARQA